MAKSTKTAIFNMRIDPDLKREAEELFASFGLNLSDAVTMFFHQAVREQGLPFELKRQPAAEAKPTNE